MLYNAKFVERSMGKQSPLNTLKYKKNTNGADIFEQTLEWEYQETTRIIINKNVNSDTRVIPNDKWKCSEI